MSDNDLDLWPLTVKTVSATPTETMNICLFICFLLTYLFTSYTTQILSGVSESDGVRSEDWPRGGGHAGGGQDRRRDSWFCGAQINDDRQIELFHLSSMRRRDSPQCQLGDGGDARWPRDVLDGSADISGDFISSLLSQNKCHCTTDADFWGRMRGRFVIFLYSRRAIFTDIA